MIFYYQVRTEETNIEIKEAFKYLAGHEEKLTVSQSEFIDSLRRQYRRIKSLSDKQVEILLDIKKYLYE